MDPTPTVNVAGTPADTGVVGPARVSRSAGLRLIVTSAVFPATLAMTFVTLVVVTVVAVPDASVVAEELDSEPASVLNETDTPSTPGRPDTSSTRAEISAVPPDGPSV